MIGRVAFAAVLFVASAPRADDAALGRALFQPCSACHAQVAGKPGMAGPDLAGLKGRRVGGAAGYDYSPAMKQGLASGAVWDLARLVRFLADPDEMFPGLWMSAQPIRGEADRQALAAYLLQQAP